MLKLQNYSTVREKHGILKEITMYTAAIYCTNKKKCITIYNNETVMNYGDYRIDRGVEFAKTDK